ncbi:MAG: trigger factor [bacterium]|nr:trigger factor [bacterium]
MQLQNVKVTRVDAAWEAEIKAEIPAELLLHYRTEALKEIKKTAKLDGFRPGKAPEEQIIQVYGEAAILREAVQHAIQHELPELLAAQKLLIIESPRVTTDDPIRQLAEGKPLTFTARAALAPSVELPDYKKIAKKHPPAGGQALEVSDAEHQEALTHLRRERSRIDKIESGTEAQKAAEESRAAEAKDLPELDDAFVQSLGYESAEKFSEALRANIRTEKEMQAREKRRALILDELVRDSKISYPAALREYELDDMEARLKDDLSRIGQTLESYFTQTKKTREQVRGEWKDAADKRAKVRLILTEIARKESIEPDLKALNHELEHARKAYQQADPIALRAHISHAMRNDATLQFLEGAPPAGGQPPTHHHHDH